jgi:DnaJ domain
MHNRRSKQSIGFKRKMHFTTHYDTLKVHSNASPEAIKTAYRALCKQHHPDRNPSKPEASAKMAEINVAYEILSDPERRLEYDQKIQTIELAQRKKMSGVSPYQTLFFVNSSRSLQIVMGRLGVFRVLWAVFAITALGFFLASLLIDQKESEVPQQLVLPKVATKRIFEFEAEAVYSSSPRVDIFEKFGFIRYTADTPLPDSEFDFFGSSLGQDLPTTFLGKKVLDTNAQQVAYFYSSTPLRKAGEKFDCHACKPLLSMTIVKQLSTGQWTVSLPLRPITYSGAWGKAGDIELAKFYVIGQDRFALITHHHYMAQGLNIYWIEINEVKSSSVQETGSINIGAWPYGEANGRCIGRARSEYPRQCDSIKGQFEFSNEGSEYFPLYISLTGEKYDEISKKLQPFNEKQTWKSVNGRYTRVQ